MTFRHAALAATLLGSFAGCDSCHNRKPYTPYTLGDSPSATSSAGPLATPPAISDAGTDGGDAFAVVNGIAAPGDGKTWPLAGGEVAAPPGRTFGVGLTLDIDGDGVPDLIAWARSPDGARGELWLASGKKPDAPRVVAALPGDLAAPGCNARASLAEVGPKAIVFDYEPHCPSRAQGHPARWIALLTPRPTELGLLLELRVADLGANETLKPSFDARDRDADGRADVAVTLSLSNGTSSASATLAFLDRPAGLSRDASEPEASLKSAAATIGSQAKKRATASKVRGDAAAFQRLYAALCEESGHAVVSASAGAIRCGEGHLVDDVVVAEVEAALAANEPATAMEAIGRLDAMSDKPRKDVEKLLGKSVPSIAATLAKKTTAAPVVAPAPSFSPLAFLPSGDLLVKTKDGAVRVDKTSFAEAPEPIAVFPDKLAWPADAPKWTLASVARRCADRALVASFRVAESAEPVTATLPIATAPKCGDAASVPVTMLADTTHGSLIAVGAGLVELPWSTPPKADAPSTLASSPGLTVPLGTSRSPDGGTIALATSRGVLVLAIDAGKQGKGQLWKSSDLDGATACVPSDRGKRISCVIGGAAAIFDGK